MPSYDILLEDFSPMIVYSGSWQAHGSNDKDTAPAIANFSGSSFHRTHTSGSSAILNFFGTGVKLKGSKQPSYGSFNVTLDGEMSTVNAFKEKTNLFQTALFTSTKLSVGLHTLTINCTGESFDIYSITVVAGDGRSNTAKNRTVLDDGDSSITYLPSPSLWSTNVIQNKTDYNLGTAHISRKVNTSLEASFTGNALELYGSTGADRGLFSVQIDDGDITVLNASSTQYHKPSVPLYIGGGFRTGNHTLKVTNYDGSPFDIDQIIVYTWEDFESGISSTASSEISKTTSRTGMIVGIVISMLVFLAFLLLGIFFMHRRRRRNQDMWNTQLKVVETVERRDSFLIAVHNQEPNPRTNETGALLCVLPSSSEDLEPIAAPFTETGFRSTGTDQVSGRVLASQPQNITPPVNQVIDGRSSSTTSNGYPSSQGLQVIRESDAGPVTTSGVEQPVRLPPNYEQATNSGNP